MYKCTDCGAMIFERVAFCSNCGNNEFVSARTRFTLSPDPNVADSGEQEDENEDDHY